MKEVLRDQYYADITMMTAFRELVAHLLRIYVVQQIVQDHEARSAVLRVAKCLGNALVYTHVFSQLSRGDGISLARTPDYAG